MNPADSSHPTTAPRGDAPPTVTGGGDGLPKTSPIGDRPAPGSPLLPEVPGYEILALVGRGGMGKVYRARHVALGRVVAIKVLAHEPDEMMLARFRDEARAVARLSHPNIAQLFETGLAEGRPFYALEFVDGGSLAQAFAGKPQEPLAAARVVEAVARAIHHSHEHGILHRDLKPGNVLLTTDGTPKVTDFGLAKHIEPPSGGGGAPTAAGGLTRTGEILGTPGYMPPEQASGVVSGIGPRADVYGLGAILYEALTGRAPFTGPDPLQTLLMVLSMDPVAPRALQPGLPRDIETVCLKCLEKSPGKRYATAAELADDLKRFLNREPILARPVGFVERSAKWARRNPWQALAAAMASAGVVALIVGLVWATAKTREVRDANATLAATVAQLEQANKDITAAKTETEEKSKEVGEANKNLTAAKTEIENTLGLTLAALDRYFFEFSDGLQNLPGGPALRREVLDQAGRVLDKLGELRPNDPTIRNYQMAGYDRLGNAEGAVGRTERAEAAYRRAKAVAEKLVAEFPTEPLYRRNVAISALKLGGVAQQLGRPADAAAWYAEAEAVGDILARNHPDDLPSVEFVGHVQLTRYGRAYAARNYPVAERELRALVDTHHKLVRLDPTNPNRELKRIETEMMLAGFLISSRKFDGVEGMVAAAVEAVKKLPDPDAPNAPNGAQPDPVKVRKLRMSVRGTLGMLRDNQNRPVEAMAEYAAVLADARVLGRQFPDNPQYRFDVGTNLWWVGQTAFATHCPAEARRAWEEAFLNFAMLAWRFPAEVRHWQYVYMTAEDLAQFKAAPPEKKP